MRGSKSILLLELPRQLLQIQSSNNNGTSVRPCECALFACECVCESVCGCKLIVNTDSHCRVTHVCNLPSTRKYAMKNVSHSQIFHTINFLFTHNCYGSSTALQLSCRAYYHSTYVNLSTQYIYIYLCNCNGILPQGLMVQTSGNFHYAATEAEQGQVCFGFFQV